MSDEDFDPKDPSLFLRLRTFLESFDLYELSKLSLIPQDRLLRLTRGTSFVKYHELVLFVYLAQAFDRPSPHPTLSKYFEKLGVFSKKEHNNETEEAASKTSKFQ